MKKIILPDIVAVGIYNAQLVFKNKSISPNRKTTMFELELPLESGGVSYIDDSSHIITENVVICAKPGQTRHTKLPFKCYYLHIMVPSGYLLELLSSFPNYITIPDKSDLSEIFQSLCTHYDIGKPENDILMQSLILKLIYTLAQYAPSHRLHYLPKRNNHEIIERTIEYIRANPTADLSLNTICERVNFTPIYFHKLFKASTGKTLHEYVEEERIKKAIDLMISTDMTLTQIAYECGFSSQSYFSYAFKHLKGTSPRIYAKKLLEKYDGADA